MLKILFVCTGNSCRSQMAEGWARELMAGKIESYSAGIENHGLDPRAVRVMAEVGVDIASQQSKRVVDLLDEHFDFVVTLSEHACTSMARLMPDAKKIHIDIESPPRLAAAASTEADRMMYYRCARDAIRSIVELLIASLPRIALRQYMLMNDSWPQDPFSHSFLPQGSIV
jgi:arsenate reductase (thioredoxin)